MTRRDYVLMANAMRLAESLIDQFSGSPDHDTRILSLRLEGLSLAVIALAETLKAANPRFNSNMFFTHITGEYEHDNPEFHEALAKTLMWHKAGGNDAGGST